MFVLHKVYHKNCRSIAYLSISDVPYVDLQEALWAGGAACRRLGRRRPKTVQNLWKNKKETYDRVLVQWYSEQNTQEGVYRFIYAKFRTFSSSTRIVQTAREHG